ncbi:hypothetical protein SeD_B0082 (plasmid) [Salmonella enterica subsp. enterica serovar Dublin str. CT_02021853]|uniref:Uncharacterized protein n=2 Tax=Salmonella dublin TaxID=98360 RepID=A0A8X6JVW8_SALDU|nr:hypothetical protein SeD_B0082 [Salmonella enterica subsp. enterica serovar Dublin str. CT_02021853]EGE28003.1 hypothetical protein SD3246_p063 [Salmonella enterica subsp. enterica serovar Dublin str. SD3246]
MKIQRLRKNIKEAYLSSFKLSIASGLKVSNRLFKLPNVNNSIDTQPGGYPR